MEKKHLKMEFLILVVFVGIILTVTVYLGTTALFYAAQGENGKILDGDGDFGPFNYVYNAVYNNGELRDVIKSLNYNLFHEVSDTNTVVGSKDFLFEITDSENGYNYFSDYMGETPFLQVELDAITENIRARQAAFEAMGKQYVMVIVPASVTVYSDYVPVHFGKPSQNSRRSQLSLAMAGEPYYIDLTSVLSAATENGQVYNNTEDSLSMYGAYVAFSAVHGYLDDGSVMYGAEDLKFYTHRTAGKTVARNAGVADIVKNRTVSYTDAYNLVFGIKSDEASAIVTERTLDDGLESGNITVTVWADSDKYFYPLMPFFSNTYKNVCYVTELNGENSSLDSQLVIEIVSERNLESLIGDEWKGEIIRAYEKT